MFPRPVCARFAFIMANLVFVRVRGAWLPALCALVSVLVGLSAKAQALFRYERTAIEAGEMWRLVTGHFAHLGWAHLGLNLAALALVWLLVGHAFSRAAWLVVMLMTMLGVSAGLWFLEPGLDWYVGLSGVLHGLWVAGALALLGKQREAIPMLILAAAKLVWEQWAGPLPGSSRAVGGFVIVDAHLYGALSGAAAWAAVLGWRNLTAVFTSSKPA